MIKVVIATQMEFTKIFNALPDEQRCYDSDRPTKLGLRSFTIKCDDNGDDGFWVLCLPDYPESKILASAEDAAEAAAALPRVRRDATSLPMSGRA